MDKSKEYFAAAAGEAAAATCHRAKCGAVVVAEDGEIIGRGYNAPPLGDEAQRMCDRTWDLDSKPKYDKTCCVHAEWNAILDACKQAGSKIKGATLYFMRLDAAGNFTDAGEPFCTVCSRLALASGVSYFALWNDGPDVRPTAQYNQQSYAYYGKTA